MQIYIISKLDNFQETTIIAISNFKFFTIQINRSQNQDKLKSVKIQNTKNSTKLINKVAQLYREEIIYNSSNSVEGLIIYLDELVAKLIYINKEIITTAR